MKKKVVLLFLVVVMLLSACSSGSDKTYKMVLDSGEEIVVEYDKCFYDNGFVECYEDGSWRLGTQPDVVYKVTFFELLKNNESSD